MKQADVHQNNLTITVSIWWKTCS